MWFISIVVRLVPFVDFGEVFDCWSPEWAVKEVQPGTRFKRGIFQSFKDRFVCRFDLVLKSGSWNSEFQESE